MKASQTRIKNSIAEKGVTIDVGAGLLAKAADLLARNKKPRSSFEGGAFCSFR